jgi:hypothetical protein
MVWKIDYSVAAGPLGAAQATSSRIAGQSQGGDTGWGRGVAVSPADADIAA